MSAKQTESEHEQLFRATSELLNISIVLEKASMAIGNLCDSYFALNIESHEKDGGIQLLFGYDEARVFCNIVSDYVEKAMELTDNLQNSINIKEGGKPHERRTQI